MTTAAPPTVLVVDDNAEFLHAVRAVLVDARVGLTVEVAATGHEAIEKLRRGPRPAFVVLDYHLPDLDAPEVLRRMGAVESLRSLPVLVLSQADWERDRRRALEAGAWAFRVKPSRVRQLREVLLELWPVSQADGDPDC
jgi:two-component system chemotaxis response regulator CheY